MTPQRAFPDPSFLPIPRWRPLWTGMPEFLQTRQDPVASMTVRFDSLADLNDFAQRIGQPITPRTKSLWHPQLVRGLTAHQRYVGHSPPPRYPVYIVSKGRWTTRWTATALDRMSIPYHMIVEHHERDAYAAVMDPATLLTLPHAYLDTYDTCDAYGDQKSKGPGAARNFAWDHALSHGAARYWVLDDNMDGFFRLNRNRKVRVDSAAIFRAAEDFVDRYSNVPMAGFNYEGLCKATDRVPPFVLNTRIYSCVLLDTACPFRWRARYNEDTDLSLRLLKAGYCTVLFNAFLCRKLTTQRARGGNTTEFYRTEGTRPKSEMLASLHPDVAHVVERFHRWHHHVDYTQFRANALTPRAADRGDMPPNEYGMTLT